MSLVDPVLGLLRRHRLAARSLLAEFALVGVAWLIISTWQSDMANVVFGIVVIFAGAFAVMMTLVGGSIAAGRLVHG